MHPLATPSDAIGVRTIRDIKHRTSYSAAEFQFGSSLVNRYFGETFSPGRSNGLWRLIVAGLFRPEMAGDVKRTM
jgi:hypothetical protein